MSASLIAAVPAQIRKAGSAADEAAAEARRKDANDCLDHLAKAMPGSDSAAAVPATQQDWKTYLEYWVRQADEFGSALNHAANVMQGTDAQIAAYVRQEMNRIDLVQEPS